MIYLIGDSHATEISFHFQNDHVIWKTILGYGLQSITQNSKYYKSEPKTNERILEILSEVEPGKKILLSHTDVDGRAGMGSNTSREELLEDYRLCMNIIFEKTKAREIHFLDWYGIKNGECSTQNCTQQQRVVNRRVQLEVLNEISPDFPIFIHTTMGNLKLENEEGFALPGVLKDDCHYNLLNETVREELFEKYQSLVAEE